jgi:hypothetical protein
VIHRPTETTSAAAPRPDEVFDVARAEFSTRRLAVEQIIDLLPISHAPERIATYRNRMIAGDRFPPIAVIKLFGRYVIADGHKRYSAYRGLHRGDILVEVWPYHRWLRDQLRQTMGNARKNGRILAASVTDPAQAWRMLLTTLLHWRRVATSLWQRAAGRAR